uniref:VLIG-type G domain-containing protein n=1 Tax=Leptobrachium leishanense TaxID=445787 RepID=A0A8C5QBQ8_9ANUR
MFALCKYSVSLCQSFLAYIRFFFILQGPNMFLYFFYSLEIFKELLEQLGMKDNISKDFKLTLKDYLIVEENFMEIKQSVPWRYFRKLMALNRTARNTVGQGCQSNQRDDNNSVHPLDVVCVLLHCSDHLLQQEIVSKMSMCQFAVPLLLPAGDGTYCTLMLGAMRDIVKRWRPHSLADSKGLMEDNVVNVSMPTFSFVRLGKTKLSKSKILNQVLSQDQQHLDFFIHDNMEGGNIERKISNGLVEMSWYFPSGSDSILEPIAVTNLRGNLESNLNQFSFLSRVSTAVFIFTESIGEREIRILSKCDNSSTKYYFILSPSPRIHVRKKEYEKFKTALSGKGEIIKKEETENDSDFQKKIIQVIQSSITRDCKRIKIQDMEQQTSEPYLRVDELYEELLTAKDFAGKITKEIKDVIQYKKETMILQGDLWRQISKLEKEMCARRNQTTTDSEEHPSELKRQLLTLREKQFAHHLPPGIQHFIEDFANLSHEEKPYYLKCIKSDLDSVSRETRLALREKHSSQKDPCKKQEQHQLDQKISDSSLGIEHFLREMGQIYESENFISKEKGIKGENAQIISKLPGIAADILLDGFPLELIDGDASNIPMQWITDILQEVDTKTGGRCRMRVITVLGVQGTGKSTLLNTMFGLQFPVASGRCTRGAFMNLIRVGSNLKKKMGCDFILVIDTEGLRAPELASLEGSYEHDKELATLVVRFSDVTIVNMDMKNTIGEEGILKIVIHSLLIMKKGNKKLNCQFVHQKVPDPSTQEELMRDKNTFQEMLDKMTADTATVAGKPGISRFSDLVEFSIDEDHWYVPNMLIGGLPMASISIDYSERIFKLKKHLINIIKQHKPINAPLGIKEFISWIDRLCEAVKRENPVYSSTPSGGPKYGT